MVPDLKTPIVQIVVICSFAHVLGRCFQKLRQPRMVGEIIAGILLGPSLLGWAAPSVSAFLFPPKALGPLYVLGQLGLLLFMFQIGLELDVHNVRPMGRAVVFTSGIGILVPFAAGAGLALFLYCRLSAATVPLLLFALFMGTAMSITAFPVLARILTETGLLKSKIGSIAIACAAVDDVTAWCLLAVLIIMARLPGTFPLLLVLAGLACYVTLMVRLRPFLKKHVLRRSAHSLTRISADTLAILLLFMLASAWVTEWLGIHALFGAFFAGVVLPKDEKIVQAVISKFEMIASVLLLPLFFAFTGLRTSVRLLNGGSLWLYCGLIVLVAVSGKLLGCAISARSTGVSWREALALGVLMNTRGLVELVVLNVGLDLNIISPTTFSMMVIMALFTTFMTSPILGVVYPLQRTVQARATSQFLLRHFPRHVTAEHEYNAGEPSALG